MNKLFTNIKSKALILVVAFFGLSLNAYSQYCTTGLYSIGCSSGDHLGEVHFHTISNVTGTSCPPNAYADFTNMTAVVTKGQSYPLTVGAAGTWSQGFGVWIDYNQNGSFGDPGEFVYASPTSAAAPTTFSTTITIPNTALSGPTRMRVRGTFASTLTASQSCTQLTYGDTEDYTVLILGSAMNDAGVTAIDSPMNFCAGTHNIKATIQNYGINLINSVTVNWSLNGTVQTPFQYNNPLDTIGGSGVNKAQVLLGTNNFVNGQNYVIKVWTSNPNGVQDTSNINDTITRTIGAALTGTFTVGGTNPDYPTITAALTDINTNGLCGPVVLNIRPGIYNGNISLSSINGASSTNTITIQSENGDSSTTIIRYGATGTSDNFVVSLDNTSHVRIRNLTLMATGSTYSRVIDISGTTSDITIENNIIFGDTISPGTSSFQALVYDYGSTNNNNLKFHNNIMKGGSYGIYTNGSSTSSKQKGLEIINNKIHTYYRGLYLYTQEAPKVIGNEISSNKYGTYTSYYGIYAYYIDSAAVISRNIINVETGIYGMYLGYWYGNAASPGIVSNNFVHVGGTGTGYGIYNLGVNYYLNIVHNSINITNTNLSSGRAFYTTSSGNNVNVINNIFSNTGGGYAAYFSSTTSLNIVNFNNYYAPNSNTLAYWTGARAFLSDLKLASGKDANSVSVNPYFRSTTNLHANLPVNNLGTPLSYVTVDIDGEVRSTTAPDIGADEFTPSPIDVSTIALLSPVEGCGLSSNESITVRIINFGQNNLTAGQSIPISYQINNNPVVTETLTLGGNLNSLAITNYTFTTTANLIDSNTFSLKVWSSITGDGNRENDTTTVIIHNSVVSRFAWIEDFETMSLGATGRYGRGWGVPEKAAQSWTVGSGQTPSGPTTGPFHDFNPKTFNGKYMFMETNSGSSGSEFILGSPCINISALSNPGINFAYHMYGTGIGSLHLDIVTSDTTYSNVWEMIGEQGNAWQQAIVDLSPFKGIDILQLQFRGIRGGNTLGDIAIDDIRVGNIPALNFPSVINDCGFLRLDAGNPGATYDWSTGETTRKIEIVAGPVSVNKQITLLVTTADGMRNFADFEVNLAPGPYVFLGNDTLICDQSSYTLDAGNPGATYEWDNGTLNQTRSINSSGTFYVEVNHINCLKADTIEVTMESSPVASFTYIDNPNNGVTVFNSNGSVGSSYKWFFGDGFGSNVANPTHQYTSRADSILVTLIVSNACGSDTLRQTIANVNTGINDPSSITTADVYPNPSNGNFTIEVETVKTTDIELTVFNMQGQLLSISQFEKTNKLTRELDLSDQAKGVYYLKIKAGTEVTVKKLVIQ